jgi:hypothetical protein
MNVKIEDNDVLEMTLASSAMMELALSAGKEIDICIETPGVVLVKVGSEELCRLVKTRAGFWTET